MALSQVQPVMSVLVKQTSDLVSNSRNTIDPQGYKVNLKATNSKHFNFVSLPDDGLSFGSYLKKSLLSTNQSIVNSEILQEKLITDPESVNLHEVTIAAKEAEVSLNLAKTVINKLISGYKDLINIR